jgi:two-component sensor histidine kinase
MHPILISTGEALRALFSNITDFVARLTIGRFLVFSLLLIIAANMLESLVRSDSDHKRKPVIHITRDVRSKPVTPETPPVPTEASPGATAQTPAPPAAKEGPNGPESNQIDITIGNQSISIQGKKDLKDLDKRIDEQIEREVDAQVKQLDLRPSKSISFPGLAMLTIVLLLIVRLVAKSKVRAEERARTAETAADSADLSRQLAEAKLQAMQAQVEPHFLFNTLAAVEHLIETDPPRAAAMQRNLIAYLRSVLPNLRQSDSTLGREAEISRNYLEILKVRMESRLCFEITVPAGLESATMPPLMLQSLVENAIEHGLEPKTEGGVINISAAIRDGQLIVTVADTGVGFAGTVTEPSASGPQRGVGLGSLRERLAALFGARGKLIIEPNQPSGTRAILEFPYAYKPNQPSTPGTDRR